MVTCNQKNTMKTSFFYFSYAKDWKSILCAAEGKYGWKLALERNVPGSVASSRAASLISYSATPRVSSRICLGAEHKIDFRVSFMLILLSIKQKSKSFLNKSFLIFLLAKIHVPRKRKCYIKGVMSERRSNIFL